MLLSVMGLLAAVTACSDDTENPYASEKTIQIVSADVQFDPQGGTGSVVVAAPNGVTGVECTASWISTSVVGNAITVSAAANTSVQGRSARLTIRSLTETAYIVVQQLGVDFIFEGLPQIQADRDGDSFTFYTKSNVPFTITSDVEWIKVSVEGNQAIIKVEKNEQFQSRTGVITCVASGTTKTTTIVQEAQVSPAEKMKGDYYLYYYSSSKWNGINVTLEQVEGDNWQIRFVDGEFAEKKLIIPVKVDVEAGTMTINNLCTIEGDGSYNGEQYSLIGYVLRLNISASSYGRVNNANFAIVAPFAKDENGVQFWDFDVNDAYDKTAYGYYGFRIAYTTGGYSGQVANLYTWPYAYLEKK